MSLRNSPLAPLPVHYLKEAELLESPETFDDPNNYNPDVPIAIDFGSMLIRAGYAADSEPSHVFLNRLSRFRDRKLNKTLTFIGNDTLLDQAVRTQSKSPYDGQLITNWEQVDEILQYTFHHLGVVSREGEGIANTLILNEKLAAIQSQRTQWYHLLFDIYRVPYCVLGIDSLYAFRANNDNDATGLIIDFGNEDTSIIPIVDGHAVLAESKRINWGGRHAIEYLINLIALKYPYFPTKLSFWQYQNLYESFCYVSERYEDDIETILTMQELETKDIVIEVPFTETVHQQKTEEELRIQAEKRRETGRRLQEQQRKKRMEKLVQKQEEFDYYSRLKAQLEGQSRKQVLSIIINAGFDDEKDFNTYLLGLEKALKKAHANEANEDDDDEQQLDTSTEKFNLVDVPDEELNEEQLKEKKKQRFLKASLDARIKIKEEKLRLKQEEEDRRRKDEEWRERDIKSWIKDKRGKLQKLNQRRKDRIKLRNDLKDRKSQVSQSRMKNIASLADDGSRGPNPAGAKRNRQQATIDNDPNDTFGANDDDWLVYSDIAQGPEALEELIEEDYNEIVELERLLLEHDPNFTDEDTLDAQYDWRNSKLHLFLRGPRPFNSENPHEQHQLHLNVERIRVPEVIFQPTMGGLDCAGISELAETILLRKFGSDPRKMSDVTQKMAQNIWITGGNAKIPGLKERLITDLRSLLPADTQVNVNISDDPSLDAWRGMRKLALDAEELSKCQVSQTEYRQYGPNYLKEHKLGNVKYLEDD